MGRLPTFPSLIFSLLLSTITFAETGIYLEEEEKIRKDLGIVLSAKVEGNAAVKVAVLDNGFAGLNPENPSSGGLPTSTNLISTYEGQKTLSLQANEEHGARTARIIWGMTGRNAETQMRLYNANGQTNFELAMRAAMEWGAQVIYCGYTIPTLGNFSGDGNVNQLIADAVAKGIIFVSPAGNYGGMVHNESRLKTKEFPSGHWLQFNTPSPTYLSFKNHVDENEVTITASWRFDPDRSIDPVDLDLHLYLDGTEQERIALSEKVQVRVSDTTAGTTVHSMEQISKVKLKGYSNRNYQIAVKHSGGTLTSKDFIRVSIEASKPDKVDPETKAIKRSLTFTDATEGGEIMTIADSVGITVGDYSSHSSRGPTRDGRSKPDVLIEKNAVRFSDLHSFAGTTIASALFAGMAVVLKSQEPNLDQRHLLALRKDFLHGPGKGRGYAVYPAYDRLVPELDKLVNSTFGSKPLYQVATAHSPHVLLSPLPASEISGFETLPKAVQEDPDRYGYFLFVIEKRSGKYQTIRDPDRVETIPAHTETIREAKPAHYATVRRYRNEIQNGYYSLNYGGVILQIPGAQTVRVPYDSFEYVAAVPAQTRYVPEKTRKIPGQVRKVELPPTRTTHITHFDRKEGKFPSYTPPNMAEAVEIQTVAIPQTDGKGLIIDGSEKDPKFWQMPTANELTQVMKEVN